MSGFNHNSQNSSKNMAGDPAKDRLVFDDSELALITVLACPGIRVLVFEPTWSAVDRAREEVAAIGLDHRVAVHHSDARRAANAA